MFWVSNAVRPAKISTPITDTAKAKAEEEARLQANAQAAEEKRLASYWADPQAAAPQLDNANRDLFRFSQLAMTPAATPVAGQAPRHQMQIIRGPQASTPTP